MEQTVWLYFGVIAVIIGIAVILQLVFFNVEKEKEIAMDASLDKLANFCNFICLADLNQMLSQNVELVSGARLYSQEKALCYRLNENNRCRECKCEIFDGENFDPSVYFELDLTSPQIMEIYNKHVFQCSFTRVQPFRGVEEVDGVTLECRG